MLNLAQLRSRISLLRFDAAIAWLASRRDTLERRIERNLRSRETHVARCFAEDCPRLERLVLRRQIAAIDRALDRDMCQLDRMRHLARQAGITLEPIIQ